MAERISLLNLTKHCNGFVAHCMSECIFAFKSYCSSLPSFKSYCIVTPRSHLAVPWWSWTIPLPRSHMPSTLAWTFHLHIRYECPSHITQQIWHRHYDSPLCHERVMVGLGYWCCIWMWLAHLESQWAWRLSDKGKSNTRAVVKKCLLSPMEWSCTQEVMMVCCFYGEGGGLTIVQCLDDNMQVIIMDGKINDISCTGSNSCLGLKLIFLKHSLKLSFIIDTVDQRHQKASACQA